jgi:hypothetical protein
MIYVRGTGREAHVSHAHGSKLQKRLNSELDELVIEFRRRALCFSHLESVFPSNNLAMADFGVPNVAVLVT